jgi:hypothetical protein
MESRRSTMAMRDITELRNTYRERSRNLSETRMSKTVQ